MQAERSATPLGRLLLCASVHFLRIPFFSAWKTILSIFSTEKCAAVPRLITFFARYSRSAFVRLSFTTANAIFHVHSMLPCNVIPLQHVPLDWMSLEKIAASSPFFFYSSYFAPLNALQHVFQIRMNFLISFFFFLHALIKSRAKRVVGNTSRVELPSLLLDGLYVKSTFLHWKLNFAFTQRHSFKAYYACN